MGDHSPLDVGNVVTIPAMLLRWRQNTTSQNMAAGMSDQFHIESCPEIFVFPETKCVGRRPCDQLGKLVSADGEKDDDDDNDDDDDDGDGDDENDDAEKVRRLRS